MKSRFRIFYLITAIFFSGCGFLKPVQQPALKQIPQSFLQSNDTTNSATIKWRDFFSNKTLVAYIDTALNNNPDLLAVTQQIEIAKANLHYHKGILFPAVVATASAGIEKYSHYSSDYAGNSTTDITPGETVPNPLNDFNLGLQSSWEADVTGKLRNMKKAAAARYLESIEGKNWAVTNLVAEVASTYYNLLAAYNEADIISETITLQQNALDLIQIQKDAGRANELAVKQAEAQLLSSKSLLLQAQQRITETESYFNLLLGHYPQQIVIDKAQLTESIPMPVQTGIPSQLLSNRPDIKQSEYELTATKADVTAARAAFFPSLNITAGIGFNAFNTQYLFTTPQSIAWNALGSLTAPLINRSAIEASFSTAKANQLIAFYNYQKNILNGFVEVHNQLSAIINLQQIQALKINEVDAQNKSVEASTELFKTGRATYLEVILAQQNALQSKLQLVDVKTDQFISSINIYKALGGGWR
jgi:multidrug efflux system outer membrane protein